VCAGCERGCAIDLHHNRGRIYRYKPRFNPDVNSYWMCDEGRHSFTALQTETRLTAPLYQTQDKLVPEGWAEALRRASSQIMDIGNKSGANSIGAIVGALATNEEAFALKRLLKATIGSDRIAGMNWALEGTSGDDDLLIRANKNPNTRGLQALGISVDAIDNLANAVASGELKMLITLRADLVSVLGEQEFLKKFGALDYLLVLDTDANQTGQMANQVWPIAAYPEIDGSFTNFKGRVQRLHAAFPPPGQAISGIDAIARLAHALDGSERPSTAEAVFTELAAEEPAFTGLTFDLGPHGKDLSV
jgi:NADH-quinone oxidoreductase subunit G